MVYFKLIELLTILGVINRTIAYKCWVCSSNDKESSFCGQILNEANLNHYEKDVNLIDCKDAPFDKDRNRITKCMIRRSIYNGETVYTRTCVWEEQNANCMNSSPGFGHRMEACNTCMEDKCNFKLLADTFNGSNTHIETLYHIVFSLVVIVVLII